MAIDFTFPEEVENARLLVRRFMKDTVRQVPRGATIKLMQRNYVKPRSTVGPDPGRMLNPIAIVLNGNDRP